MTYIVACSLTHIHMCVIHDGYMYMGFQYKILCMTYTQPREGIIFIILAVDILSGTILYNIILLIYLSIFSLNSLQQVYMTFTNHS